MESQNFCLKWDAFQGSVTSAFDLLRQDEELVDITICCEGQRVRAHRLMLSVCSPFFKELLKNNHCDQMVVFLKDTSASDLQAIIEFIYTGSVNVAQNQLASFFKTAEMLQIRGLSGDDNKPSSEKSEDGSFSSWPATTTTSTPPSKRRRHHSGSPCPPTSAPSPIPVSAGVPVCTPSSASESPLCDGALGQPIFDGTHPSPPPPRLDPPAAGAPTRAAPSSAPAAGPVKIEKIDLTEEGDDCDATLDGPLAEYVTGGVPLTGHFAEGGGDLSLDDLSATTLTGDTLTEDTAGVATFRDAAEGGHVQRGMAAARRAHDASGAVQEGGLFTCPVCGRRYSNPRSLEYHKKVHAGLTTCALCGKVASKVEHLRRHLENVHKLTQEDIRSIVPTRYRYKGSPGSV